MLLLSLENCVTAVAFRTAHKTIKYICDHKDMQTDIIIFVFKLFTLIAKDLKKDSVDFKHCSLSNMSTKKISLYMRILHLLLTF